MRRHPPKVSRKKLKAEIKRLQGEALHLNIVNRIIIDTAQIQISLMEAEMASRLSKHAIGGIVEIHDSSPYCGLKGSEVGGTFRDTICRGGERC